MKKILIIDPFIKQPVNNCFNRLVDLLPAKLYLFQPAFFPQQLYSLPTVDAYIVLGSASHVFENLTWQNALSHFLISELETGKPVLGLCFGHQLISHHFGALVKFVHDDQQKISGSREIMFDNLVFEMGVTHRQAVMSLSANLKSHCLPHALLGYDLISHKTLPFLGAQSHPEASDQFLRDECGINDYAIRQKILSSSAEFINYWYKTYL